MYRFFFFKQCDLLPNSDCMRCFPVLFTGMPAFPVDLTRFYCSRTQVGEFARQAKEIGVQYIGLCCGNASHYIRLVAEEYGRKPDASRFAPDMSKHYRFGNKEFVKKHHSREQNL